MYATRFADGPRFRPASLGAALAVNGGVLAALLLANPAWVPKIVPHPPLTIIDVADPPPDPQPLPKPQLRQGRPQPHPTDTIDTPPREVDVLHPWQGEVMPPPGNPFGTGTGPVDPPADPPILPKFVAASEDPRYAADFQPPYPDAERDAGREGVVKLRVLIGVDGRVRQVERLDGRDSFARAATTHALAKWRFRPATRGGVPEESWRVMTVRFQLND